MQTLNKNNRTGITLTTLIVWTSFLLIILGTLNSMISAFSIVGLLALGFLLLVSSLLLLIHYFKQGEIKVTHFYILSIVSIFLSMNVIGLANNFNVRSFITIFQFITLIGFFVFFSLVEWTPKRLKFIRRTSLMFILLHFGVWIIQGTPEMFSSVYPNANLIGSYIFLMIYFISLENKNKTNLLFLTISILLIHASGARSVYVAMIATLIVYIIWPYISKYRHRMLTFITLYLSGLMAFVFIYPQLIYFNNFQQINMWVLEYTGKNIYSGREVIWSYLLESIIDRPLLGHGTGVLPRDVLDLGLSAHNLYLQVALQNGFIGLFFLLLLFVFIWMIFAKNRKNKIVRLSAAFFVGILMYQSFEVSLTQNQLSLGIMQWLILAIGISFATLKKE